MAAATKARLNKMISSLDLLNVYQAGQIRTVITGMSRIITIVVAGLGVFTVAPRMFFNPDVSNWWVPGVIVGGAIPFVALALLSAPYVSTIRVLLPKSAKKNHDSLMRFAEKVPGETKIMMQSMRWLPWPVHREMFFCDLRRLPGRKLSVNLEHIPLGHEQARNAGSTLGERLAMRMYGRYWVDMKSSNKSQAPGVWEKMWDQIPIKGQEPIKVPLADKKPVVMANRSPPTAAAASPKRPPPPVKAKGARSRK
ncbi:hypothetical protein Q7P37_007571 [Cladosporium fusiforme]